MANEITVTAALAYAKDGTSFSAAVTALSITVSGARFIHARQSIGTSEEALDLGDIGTGGWLLAINRHASAVIEIRSGTGATDLVRMNGGEPALFRVSADATAPFAIASAAADLEYWLIAA